MSDIGVIKKPQPYRCAQCAASGCKLWRDYGTIEPLLCARCAVAKAGLQFAPQVIDAHGERADRYGRRTDQIGWHLPAYQAIDGYSLMYTYTDAPASAVARWRALPTYPS
jgi:hypothetical protein